MQDHDEIVIDDETMAGHEVAIREEREHGPAPASVLPSEREWAATIAVANQIAATQFVPEIYRGQPEAVVAAILTGREMGIGPMQSLRQIHMIDGRPAFAADLMLAKMRQGGVEIVASESTKERAWIHARRRDTGEEAEVEWTMADAAEAGLASKKNWRTFPADMLWARAVGRLARRLGSDLLGGLVYSAEEARDFDQEPDTSGYQARAQREVQPDRSLLPGAIDVKDADTAAAVRAGAAVLNPLLPWDRIEVEAGEHAEGKPQSEWGAPEWGRHWKRLANAVVRAQDLGGGSDLGVHDDDIVEAFAWAFNGYVVPVEAAESEDEVQATEDQDDTSEGPEKPVQRDRKGGTE